MAATTGIGSTSNQSITTDEPADAAEQTDSTNQRITNEFLATINPYAQIISSENDISTSVAIHAISSPISETIQDQPIPLPDAEEHATYLADRQMSALLVDPVDQPPLPSEDTDEKEPLPVTDLATWIDTIENRILPKLKENTLGLEEGTDVLAQLDDIYRQTNSVEAEDGLSERLHQLINQIKPVLVEKNNASNSPTRLDAQMFNSFFVPPADKFYTDPVDQQKYALADYSQLAKLAAVWWGSYKCYHGFEVSKCQRIENFFKVDATLKQGCFSKRYDAIFFKKFSTQSFCENGIIGGIVGALINIDKTEQNQNSMHTAIYQYLTKEFESWGYIGFCLLTTQAQMEKLDLAAESSNKYHGVILFLDPKA